MKLALIFGFIAVASAYPRGGIITKSAYTGGYGVITRGAITNESILDNDKCNGPQCSGGCCPESAYVCCESGSFCASTLELDLTRKDCQGTNCPGGCCYPSITDGVHQNENFVEIIPVFSTFWNFKKKKKKS